MAKKKKEIKEEILEEKKIEDISSDTVEEVLGATTVKKDEPKKEPDKTPDRFGKVNCPRLNVRGSANMNSLVLEIISAGETVKILSESGDFYNVISSSGKNGYCMKKYITEK